MQERAATGRKVSVDEAVQALTKGLVVAIPTETVYGLAGNAEDDAALEQIFTIKGRPRNHPLIVHVAGYEDVAHFARDVPPFAAVLMRAFWPGPLTVILPRVLSRAAGCAGGQESIGLRCPSHPSAQEILKQCAARGVRGLAAPSANRFGGVSPTRAAHVVDEFGDALLIVDGGMSEIGIESTIVDCTRGALIVLRPGHIGVEALNEALKPMSMQVEQPRPADAHNAPRAPGTLLAHYAPRAKLRLMSAESIEQALHILGGQAQHIAVYSRAMMRIVSPQVHYRRMPDDAVSVAQQLFAVLREFDAHGVKLIWVEIPPVAAAWDGVRDRLQRASHA